MPRMGRVAAPINLAVACALVLVISPPARAQALSVAGVIKNSSGSTLVLRAGREMPAVPGQAVSEGDTVKTGADGRLGLTLKDGTRLSVGANTELRIESFAYAPAEGRLGVVLKLLRGAAGYVSGRIAQLAPGTIKIETPTSVIGVRGTHLLIGVGQP